MIIMFSNDLSVILFDGTKGLVELVCKQFEFSDIFLDLDNLVNLGLNFFCWL